MLNAFDRMILNLPTGYLEYIDKLQESIESITYNLCSSPTKGENR